MKNPMVLPGIFGRYLGQVLGELWFMPEDEGIFFSFPFGLQKMLHLLLQICVIKMRLSESSTKFGTPITFNFDAD